MTVESATYINELDNVYPLGTDYKSEGDDHIRLIKAAIKNTFPSITGEVTATHDELNYVDGVTSNVQTQLDDLAALVAANAVLASGTVMLFVQTAAPTGWTKSTTHNNKTLRVVSGTASSGGSVDFSTVFGLTATDAFTLTASHIPTHSHTIGTESAHTHSFSATTSSDGAHTHSYSQITTAEAITTGSSNAYELATTGTTGSSGAHTHTVSGTSGSGGGHTHTCSDVGSGGSHAHDIDLRVKYVDVIIASLD